MSIQSDRRRWVRNRIQRPRISLGVDRAQQDARASQLCALGWLRHGPIQRLADRKIDRHGPDRICGTNGPSVIPDFGRVAAYFEVVVISGEFGVGKPEPSIFEHALSLLGSDREHTVMVGDSLARDVDGAIAAGLRGVWVNRSGSPPPENRPGLVEITAGVRVALVEQRPDAAAFKRICSHFTQSSAVPTLERLGLLEAIEEAGGLRAHARIWTRWGWIEPCPERVAPSGVNLRRELLDPMIRRKAAETPGVLQSWSGDTRERKLPRPFQVGAHGRRRRGARRAFSIP